MKIPFLSFAHMHAPLKKQMQEAFDKFYDSGYYVLGSSTSLFEEQYAAWNHTKYCIGVSNGLDALIISLKALGIQHGDEVIVPSNTYIATWLSVTHVGAKIVPVEPDIHTYNIDPQRIAEAITPAVKCVIPVHLYGQACDMEKIMQLSQQHNLVVVEDNAQAHGATFKGKMTGSWGDANAVSFYPGKNLGALGEAGAVTTNNESVADTVKMLRNYGSKIKYENELLGYNMRIDELQAALLAVKLQYLDTWISQRRQIAAWYNVLLKDVGDLILPVIHPDATHVYHLYVIRTKYRDQLQKFLAANGIGSLIHYPIPPHLQNAYAHLGYKKGSFPIAEEIAQTCMSLPLWPGIDYAMAEEVSHTIKSFFNTL